MKPFGSVFFHNGARSVWHVKRNDDEGAGSETVELALSHRKSNTGKRLPTLGLRMRFTPTSTRIEPFDVAGGSDDLVKSLPIWQRVKSLVSSAPMSIADLATELDANPQSIARIVRRMEIFTRDDQDQVCLATATLTSRSTQSPDEGRF
jgi:hypothetical protein